MRLQDKSGFSTLTSRSVSGSANVSVNRTPNALTVDVEDYFHVSAFENYIARDSWNKLELRVNESTDRILDTFSARGISKPPSSPSAG